MSARFDACLAHVLRAEGGYVDLPADPGGATNMGITRGTLAAWRGRPVSKQEVRDLSRAEAGAIYQAQYWQPMRCEELPAGVDLMVFDFGVNAGPVRSVKLLQRSALVRDDGAIGPITLEAVAYADPLVLITRLARGREKYYRALGNEVFLSGWMNRTMACEAAAREMALRVREAEGAPEVAS